MSFFGFQSRLLGIALISNAEEKFLDTSCQGNPYVVEAVWKSAFYESEVEGYPRGNDADGYEKFDNGARVPYHWEKKRMNREMRRKVIGKMRLNLIGRLSSGREYLSLINPATAITTTAVSVKAK